MQPIKLLLRLKIVWIGDVPDCGSCLCSQTYRHAVLCAAPRLNVIVGPNGMDFSCSCCFTSPVWVARIQTRTNCDQFERSLSFHSSTICFKKIWEAVCSSLLWRYAKLLVVYPFLALSSSGTGKSSIVCALCLALGGKNDVSNFVVLLYPLHWC